MSTTDVNAVAVLDNGDLVHLFANGITDGTGGHVYVRDISGVNTKDIGEFAPGRRLRVLKVNASAGSILNNIVIYGKDGRILLDVDVDVELNATGGNVLGVSSNYNLVVRGLDILLEKGVYVNALTAD
jgi:hypothetical protein